MVCKSGGRSCPTIIGGNDDGICAVKFFDLLNFVEMIYKNSPGSQWICRYPEETMHLRRVKGHGHHMGCTGGLQQVSDQASSYGDTRGIFFVRSGVGEISVSYTHLRAHETDSYI